MKWKREKFRTLFNFRLKSKIKAGDGLEQGLFPFYTSSSNLSKFLNEYHFDDTSLIFGTGGSASVHYCGSKFSASTDCFITHPIDHDKVDTKFIYYYFSGNIHLLQEGFKGAGLKHLSKEYLSCIEIFLPDLPTQQHIVAILEEADTLRKTDAQILAKYDEILQATFLQLFKPSRTKRKHWDYDKLEKIADVQGGLQVSSKARKDMPISVPYLRVANVYRNRLSLSEIKKINVTESEFKRAILTKNDILVVEGHGNKNEIGRAAVWDGSIGPILHQNHLIRIRTNSSRLSPVFLCFFLNSDIGKKQLFASSNTTSGLNTISTSVVKNIDLYIPTIQLQNQFAEIVTSIEEQKALVHQQQQQSEALFQSLLQRAFKGEL